MDGFEILYKLLILIKDNSTIKDAKRLIEQLTDIKVEDQRFKFTLNFDSQMDDEDYFYKCLNCYIEDISCYRVKLKRNFYNQYIKLDLKKNIEQLKKNVFKIHKIPIERQKYYLYSPEKEFPEVLENDKTLKNVDLDGKQFYIYIEKESNDIIKLKYPNSEIKEIKTDLYNTGIEFYELLAYDDNIKEKDFGFKLFYQDKKNNKKEIELDKLLIKQGIKSGEIIEIEYKNKENTYEYHVRGIKGDTITINANPNDTILYFKFLIYLKSGYIYESFYYDLLYPQKKLEIYRTLNDYDIPKNGKMFLRWNRMGVV